MRIRNLLLFCCLLVTSKLGAGELTLQRPQDFEVVQSNAAQTGRVLLRGQLKPAQPAPVIEVQVVEGRTPTEWKPVPVVWEEAAFSGELELPRGGWFLLRVRAVLNGEAIASADIAHVGVGEIFVVAGQSNSANWGEERLAPASDRVVNFDGQQWRPAHDPQPGAGGSGGSFIPPLGDALVESFQVPVAFVTCGVGGTSVREWLPEGVAFPHPPTVKGNVRQRSSGDWESSGALYRMFVRRMLPLGKDGFRAVLWHQGESDANQPDPINTLAGADYRQLLEQLIRSSRREIGWQAPWFVAQASYHVPGDESSPEIRAAQASLWQDGIALAGPDTDRLTGVLREANGQGVHFSGAGQRAHAQAWKDAITPWLKQQLSGAP